MTLPNYIYDMDKNIESSEEVCLRLSYSSTPGLRYIICYFIFTLSFLLAPKKKDNVKKYVKILHSI